jgi:L-rhamnose-H+ transport protein
VNAIWFLVAGLKDGTLKEFAGRSGLSIGLRARNALWSALAGILWSMQFFFYGLGHVQMGTFQFASWVLHMSMLIFFSYVVGVSMKEWRNVSRSTYAILVLALILLVLSFVITSYGSYYGEQMMRGSS